MHRERVYSILVRHGYHATLCPTCHGAADVRLCCCSASSRQNEGGGLGSLLLERVDRAFELCDIGSCEVRAHRVVGIRQFAADMKQQLLYAYEHSRFSFGHAELEEQTYMGVQLVEVATHGDTYVVLRHTLATYK